MTIQSYYKGSTVTTVSFLDADHFDNETLVLIAMQHAGETSTSLFGTRVSRDDEGNATVSLYTD